ncbi:unnamed protein product [Phytophthora fragariaefolia]|uniref:Unnamed protein product n=1 Tax=Phytophthora fragariaefolia TaxID=1490495 RepID=A0A9W6XYZ2_9STRA|nr:unnamed protein product [Phytophthora fragariaefolia]
MANTRSGTFQQARRRDQTHPRASTRTVVAGDVLATTPLFTPLLPPKISSTSHAALVQWRKDRRDYEETARARVKDGAKDVIVPVKTTCDQGRLRLWCRLRWHIAIDDVTDDHIRSEVDKIIANVKNNNVPDIDYEMRSKLRMDLTETDVSERVIQYFKTCHEIIDDNGWRVFFEDDTGRKQLYRILVASLEPQALREEVERTLRFQARNAKENEVALHDLILQKALEYEKMFQRHKREKRDRGEGDNKSHHPSSRPNKSAKQELANSGTRIVNGGAPAKHSVQRPKNLKSAESCSCAVDELMLRDPVTMIRLATPVVNTTMAKHEITCINPVYLRLLLNTAAGPVALHKPVECLVIDGDEPEFILGQDVLKQLGIDIDRQLEQLARHVDDEDDDLEDFSRGVPGFEPATTDKELREAVEKMVQMALQNGFTRRLESILRPVTTSSQTRVAAVKCKPRQYPPAVRTFLREFNTKLVELGWVYENPNSRWASPVFPVHKAGVRKDEYRQTCDNRLVNDFVEALISTMPYMTTLLEYVSRRAHVTVHFQQTMENCFAPLLYDFLVIWIDDVLLFADNIDTYIAKLEAFLDLVAKYGLKLSAKKSSIYQQSVKWCGRVISRDGVSHDPDRIDTLCVMPYPTTAGQLQQFLCASNWMRESIVDYARTVDPLQQRLDAALSNGKRTKRVASGISIELSDMEKAAYDQTKRLLATSATLTLPYDTTTTCVFSDASDVGFAIVVTQVHGFDAKTDVTAQQHKLLTSLKGDDNAIRVNQRLWIPREYNDLIRGLCVIAHCGAQGHRGEQPMVNHLRGLFHIADISVCTYILVLKDHATHYCELVVCDTADSAVATTAILDWHSRFGVPPAWVSDNGSHFKNEVVAELLRRLKSHQTFTVAYSPWINGTVERVNRDILQVLRAMIMEYKISTKDWVYLVPLVQSSLSHTAVPSLGNKAPTELFTGLPCPSPVAEFYDASKKKLVRLPATSAAISKYLDVLRASLQAIHQPIRDQRLKQRLLNKKRERGENTVNFDVGDYVLRSRVDEKQGNKLLVTWQGPYKVVRADAHSFRVSHLVTGEESDVHPSRLKFYMDNSLDVT